MANDGNQSLHRLYTVTPDDHTAYIVIATAVGMAYLPIFGATRYFVRRAADVGLDDVLLVCSTILAVVQSSIILRACSYGLGRSAAVTQTGREVDAEKVRDDLYGFVANGLIRVFDLLLAVADSLRLQALLRQYCAMDSVRRHIQSKHGWLAPTTRRYQGAQDSLLRNAGVRYDLGHGIPACSHVAVRLFQALVACRSSMLPFCKYVSMKSWMMC